ncbi:amyloid protein-binding protein 2 isoform X2 [Aricia agestis]|uniref:amyloid protein-binding protein 2 isoform X2 n=1 Tax=Aricia agestis TaxID=91739 RepID=UPI001C209D51|nr:amyloid protein-binding protein 2 isoform X2 [Aricia agestis]
MKRVLFYLAKMADASSSVRIKRIPDNLYEVCLSNLVYYLQKFKCDRNELHTLPDTILMDVYYKMLQERKLCILGAELSELETFERLLRFSGNQLPLLQCFQAVIEHGSMLSKELARAYLARADSAAPRRPLIQLGLRLGGFLNEAGWYPDAERVLTRCLELCRAQPPSTYYKRLTLECCHRLLHTQSAYCCFPAALQTYSLSLQLLGIPDDAAAPLPAAPVAAATSCDAATQTDDTDDRVELSPAMAHNSAGCGVWGARALVVRLLKEFSALFFVLCDYSAAHAWSMRALHMLTPDIPVRIRGECVRGASRACVVKRRFGAAGLLARQGVALASAHAPAHPRRAHALLDLAFYLLNVDAIKRSVCVYEEALAHLRRVYGRASLHVATAQEDLAYALYVLEYSSGRFYKARDHAERAIRIIENLVPRDHLLLASAKRVKALILEEIALDTPAGQNMQEPSLLEESEALHRAALELSIMAFGEKNVQTAKHYGNLGRLYQSMQKFQDAEMMHLKAIAIKEELLGPEDYEVGLSVGHLASLYNYHMNMHRAAEKLYLRSIAISLKLFGERYSGLEYDYRGLVYVFTQLKEHDRAWHYNLQLQHWHDLREQSKTEQQPPLGDEEVMPLEELKARLASPD